MNLSPARIATQLCSQLVSNRRSDEFPDLAQYFESGGSVCALARKGVAGLVNEYGLEIEEAQALALRLNGLATWVLRQFIEEQLTSHEPPPAHTRRGLLALVDGPTYGDLFRPEFAGMCPVDAIEAIHSPVAYAVWLKNWSEQRFPVSSTAYPLKARRADLDELKIDPVAVYGVVSSVEVVSAVLEKSIEGSLESIDVDSELSERRYPNGLPYHHPWVTLDELTRELGMSVGAVVRLCDPSFPFFFKPLGWGATANHALTQSARLSPSMREVMTEPPYFPEREEGEEEPDYSEFSRDNFGLLGTIELQNLNQTATFNRQTKLTQTGLEALLSVELFAPTPSPHVLSLDEVIQPGEAGSVFVNNGAAEASMSIDYNGNEALNRIIGLVSGDDWHFDKIDRLNRKIRLDNALQLPSHETDALLSAFIRAESEDEPTDYWMTDATVRAFGLFQMLRENYQCTAEEFAAFTDRVSIYGRGTERSQFDRVFNKDTLSAPPLELDDSSFEVVPTTEKDALTVLHICSGLNIDLATYFNLAPLIAKAQTPPGLKRSREVLSSFYRMARLPQILGIAPSLAVEIFNLLGNGSAFPALAGQSHIAVGSLGKVPNEDTLTQIQRLEGWVRWCTDSGLDVAWAIEHVKPRPDPSEANEAQTYLFEQISGQLAPSLLTEAALRMAGVVQLSNGRRWTNLLFELVDRDGLVLHWAESTDRPYEPRAREVISRVVHQAIGQDDQQTVEQILGVLLSRRAGQHGVVQESLAVYGELAPLLALPVLSWSGATVYDVLAYALRRSSAADPSDSRLRAEEPGDPFLGMLGSFVYRSGVTRTLKLSREFLALYLSSGDGVGSLPVSGPLTVSALYYLTVYNRAVALSQKNESRLLGYLRLVSALPADLASDGLELVQDHTAQLLAEIFDWSAEEVRACAGRFAGGPGYVRSFEHLDLLTRLRAFALRSKLDALTALKVGQLPPDSSFADYKTVADQVAAILADPNRMSPLLGVNIVDDQVEVSCSITPPTKLIANSGETRRLDVLVTRGGTVQKNVNIYFTSTLCPIVPSKVKTDLDGKATVTVHAGTTMGRDVISYRLDAREPQPAMTITLGNDPDTFRLFKLDNEIYVSEEKVGNDITLRMGLFDEYENPAAYESVRWDLVPLFLVPFHTATNAEGITEVTFTSSEPLQIPSPTVSFQEISSKLRSIEFIP